MVVVGVAEKIGFHRHGASGFVCGCMTPLKFSVPKSTLASQTNSPSSAWQSLFRSPTVSSKEHCPCLLHIGNRRVLWPHGALAAGTEGMHTTPGIFLALKPCTVASWAIGAAKTPVLLLHLAPPPPGECPGIACGFESSVLVWLWGLDERRLPSGIHVHWLTSLPRCPVSGPLIVSSE